MNHDNVMDSLSARSVLMLSQKVALKYGLAMVNIYEFHRQYKESYPIPSMTRTMAGYLWTDRYYIAYQLYGMKTPKYVYLTRTYIMEEQAAYRSASKLRGTKVGLPKSVLSQFAEAKKHMSCEGVELWVAEDEM